MNSLGQVTKAEAKYKPLSSSPAEHRCGICEWIRHVPENPHVCVLVEGPIEDMAGCALFSVDLIKAANDKINLYADPPKK